MCSVSGYFRRFVLVPFLHIQDFVRFDSVAIGEKKTCGLSPCKSLYVHVYRIVTLKMVAECLSETSERTLYSFFFSLWRCDPTRVMVSSFLRFLDHTQWRTTVGRTPLDEWSARRRDLNLTSHNTRNRQTSMPPVGFEPTISAGERPQTYAFGRAATGTGTLHYIIRYKTQKKIIWMSSKTQLNQNLDRDRW